MKKFLSILAIVMAMVCCFSSCTKKKTTLVQTVSTLNVDQCVNMDKEYMYANYGGDYKFFESQVLLKEYLDEGPTGDVTEVTNVFQVNPAGTQDVYVMMFIHNVDGYYAINTIESFWIEDLPLTDVVLNYESAFAKMMSVNSPKPHSKHAVLRNPLGPVAVNPQWCFGNIRAQLWVDAVTGNVVNWNPAFPKPESDEQGLNTPLGEWP